MDFLNQIKLWLQTSAIGIAEKLLIGIVILVVGFLVVGQFVKLFEKVLKKRDVDETLRPFLKNVLKYILYALVIIIAASTMGLEMTSIVGVIASLGLAIGLALQGALSNFAGGVLIMILKPFKVGDLISAQGETGFVEEVNIISTTIVTPEKKYIFIPNGPLAGGNITNLTRNGIIRLDIEFGIAYTDDIDKARKIILDVSEKAPNILHEPEPPFARVISLGDSSVNFTSRIWVDPADYWDVYFYMHEEVKKAFDREGISIPFPQMDVHLDKLNG